MPVRKHRSGVRLPEEPERVEATPENPARPEEFVVQYNGEPIRFLKLYEGEQPKGYRFYCPKHNPQQTGAWNWIDTESGTRHGLTIGPRGATLNGSILCRHPRKGTDGTPILGTDDRVECGWHVIITDGVARDA